MSSHPPYSIVRIEGNSGAFQCIVRINIWPLYEFEANVCVYVDTKDEIEDAIQQELKTFCHEFSKHLEKESIKINC